MDVYYSITPFNNKTKQVDWSNPICEQVKVRITLDNSIKETKASSSEDIQNKYILKLVRKER